MNEPIDRRTLLKGGIGLAAMGIPLWSLPALGQGESVIEFTDVSESFAPNRVMPSGLRFLDTREIDDFYTTKDTFYRVRHYDIPEIDHDEYRLKISGLVDSPIAYSLRDLRAAERVELDVGFECGGNQTPLLHGLVGNARWAGVRLSTLMKDWGIRPEGSEVVFFGADKGEEEVRRAKVEMHFARSLSIQDAANSGALLAYEMNGEALPLDHGAPLRLIVPGWYGIANVKWLDRIHFQDTRYMGRFMAKDYVTLRKKAIGDETQWTMESVGKILLKSVIVRVTMTDDDCTVLGFALNDGRALKSIEVKVDDGPWEAATIDSRSTDASWKLFSYHWKNPKPGEHTIVSRATDVDGNVQQKLEEVPEKITYWENPGQWPRTVRVS